MVSQNSPKTQRSRSYAMNKTTAENIYIFIKNDKRLNRLLSDIHKDVKHLTIQYVLLRIKRSEQFYESYIPFIQKHIFQFIKEQKELEDPYSFPSKKEIIACAKIFASEAISEC